MSTPNFTFSPYAVVIKKDGKVWSRSLRSLNHLFWKVNVLEFSDGFCSCTNLKLQFSLLVDDGHNLRRRRPTKMPVNKLEMTLPKALLAHL